MDEIEEDVIEIIIEEDQSSDTSLQNNLDEQVQSGNGTFDLLAQ